MRSRSARCSAVMDVLIGERRRTSSSAQRGDGSEEEGGEERTISELIGVIGCAASPTRLTGFSFLSSGYLTHPPLTSDVPGRSGSFPGAAPHGLTNLGG